VNEVRLLVAISEWHFTVRHPHGTLACSTDRVINKLVAIHEVIVWLNPSYTDFGLDGKQYS